MNALACPTCGAPQEPDNPGIVVVVCEHCDTTLYLEEGVLAAGNRSIVAEPRSHLAVGRSAQLEGQTIRFLGRAQFVHEAGRWDEWSVEWKGRTAWIVEDERRYALEQEIEPPDLPDHPLSMGDTLVHEGVRYEVREVGEAVCSGGEGQLPRSLRVGARYRYVDLAEVAGTRLLLLEIDPDGEIEAYAGQALDPEDLVVQGRPSRPSAAALGEIQEAQSITCAGCGAPFDLRRQGEDVQTATCPHCDSILELTGAAAVVVGERPGRPHYPLAVGDTLTLLDHTWEVMGLTQWIDDEGYRTTEFCCWSEAGGYLWLEEDGGHWAWLRPSEVGPALDDVRHASQGKWVRTGPDGEKLRLLGLGEQRLVDVEGALSYRAHLGDTHRCWDLSAPPTYLSMEATYGEVEIFRGAYLEPGLLDAAVGRSVEGPRASVHLAQPNPWRPWYGVSVLLGAFAVVNLILAATTLGSGEELLRWQVPAATTNGNDQGAESPPFTLTEEDEGAMFAVHYSAPLDNSWAYVDLELVDQDAQETVAGIGEEFGYYHGYEGGESWTEGSRSASQYLRAPPPGTYRLVASTEYDRPVTVTVTVTLGERLARWYVVAAILLGLAALVPTLLAGSFEGRRLENA